MAIYKEKSSAAKKFIDIDIGSLITFALIVLCILASLDLWRQYALNTEDYWNTAYQAAVRSSEHFWRLGFHIEDLEQKIQFQTDKFEAVRHSIGVLNPPLRHSTDTFTKRRNMQHAVHGLVGNDTTVVRIRCEDLQSEQRGYILRVGRQHIMTYTYRTIYTNPKSNYFNICVYTNPRIQRFSI